MPPKSKRPFKVPGCKVMKGLSRNDKVIKKTREVCTMHEYMYLLSIENCTNTFLFGLRSHLRGSDNRSVLVYGNNKLQQVALGKGPKNELKEGVSRILKQLKFEKALLFTDLSDTQKGPEIF
uniref:Ribosome assembly factor mrt4 n=1 Tax=Chromera velia CCMP2878 TaxID=1169474 RepID=A0A0G4HEL8_9ALVE|eukprot:Cvel_26677.t1-p1 / transcript=Cvel_26677.t1 / gene=Cvel_26677 / organism=Chromera_velia_CCMP2878 / gene_product=mRNA turnover protein 4 homolog, putative / transcript_product=mRNA turnover protein 4 homolog, putative / location=Cvel_scaffold3212:14241-14684(-) / protein_length=121 / sequence_SO=supercontig / SO=protein_coding / is_pseudo=false